MCMKRNKKLKIIYKYVEPKTSEEKELQQKVLDDLFDDLFKRVIKKRQSE